MWKPFPGISGNLERNTQPDHRTRFFEAVDLGEDVTHYIGERKQNDRRRQHDAEDGDELARDDVRKEKTADEGYGEPEEKG